MLRLPVITLLLLVDVAAQAQIWRDDIETLPEDIQRETILFLKFDSVKSYAERPGGMDKSYFRTLNYHNQKVAKANAALRKIAKRYPYPYKIVSMTDTPGVLIIPAQWKYRLCG